MTNISIKNTIIVSELLDHLMQKLFVINFSMFSIIISMTIINTLGYSISNFKIFKLFIFDFLFDVAVLIGSKNSDLN